MEGYGLPPDLLNKKINSAIADLRSRQELSKGLHGISPEKVSSTYSFIHSLIELKFYLKSEFNDFYRHYDNRKMTLGGRMKKEKWMQNGITGKQH